MYEQVFQDMQPPKELVATMKDSVIQTFHDTQRAALHPAAGGHRAVGGEGSEEVLSVIIWG